MPVVPRVPPTILATCCVPWNPDFSLAGDMFHRLVRHTVENISPDVYIFGTAGEGHEVTGAQFEEICRAFKAATQDARPMVGVINISLGTIIERIACARDMGFRRFQISLPCWGALNDRELRRFFAEVCGRFPDCSFLHYNLLRTKRLVTAAEYAELAERHPNLVATKHGTPDMAVLELLVREAPMLTHFITERGFAKACLVGECAFLISLCSLNPVAGKEFYAAARAKDKATLATFEAEFATVIEILHRNAQGVAHMDGAYDKLFCRALIPDFPLRLLPPYDAFSNEHFERIIAEIREKAPRWAPAG